MTSCPRPLVSVLMPEQSGRPILVSLETTRFGGATQPQILVTLDQATGDIAYVDDPRDHGIVEQVVNFQNALHYGAAYGMVWKIVVFVSGFLPLFFASRSPWDSRRRPSKPRRRRSRRLRPPRPPLRDPPSPPVR